LDLKEVSDNTDLDDKNEDKTNSKIKLDLNKNGK
jgi:hypothetical protein